MRVTEYHFRIAQSWDGERKLLCRREHEENEACPVFIAVIQFGKFVGAGDSLARHILRGQNEFCLA